MELYYWKEDFAFCFNLAHFVDPIKMTITSSTKIEQCSMDVITSMDNWDRWFKEDQKLIDVSNKCALSPNSDITVWKYDFVPTRIDKYWLGTNTFLYNYCFPGPTPLYSFFERYPDNLLYAIKKSFDAVYYLYKTGRADAGYYDLEE